MKKIICIIILIITGINIYSQTSKAVIKTYFETGDKPTQDDFEEFIDNSYNQGTDGILEYTGNSLNIAFSPYTSKSDSGILYTGTNIPTDTTIILNYNGTFRAAKIKIGNIEIDPEGVGTTYSSGSGIYVDNVNDQIDWSGVLDTDADIAISANRINFYSPTGGYFRFDDSDMTLYQPSSRLITIVSDGAYTIYGSTGIEIAGQSSGDINIKTSTSSASDIIITDQKTIKKGVVYAADYSSDLINNDLSLINVGMTLDLINDTATDVRLDLSDSCAVLRSLIGGSGIWTQSGNKIYPISSNDSLGIGGVPTDKLYVNGNITASNLTLSTNMNAYRSVTTFCNSEYFYVNGEINFLYNNSKMYASGNDLMFYDNVVGLKTLSELAVVASASNGLTSGYNHMLGGPLIKNTTISGSYEMNFTNGTFSATPISSLELGCDASVSLEYGYDSVTITNGSPGSHGPYITDLKTIPEGLKYFEEYALYDKDGSIPDVRNIKKIQYDSIYVDRWIDYIHTSDSIKNLAMDTVKSHHFDSLIVGDSPIGNFNVKITANNTYSDIDDYEGAIQGNTTAASTSASTDKQIRGIHGRIEIDGTNTQNWTNTGINAGIMGEVVIENGATGTFSGGFSGITSVVGNTANVTIPNLYGVNVSIGSTAGTINGGSLLAGQFVTGITNRTGLLLGTLNTPTGNYSIYDSLGYTSYFSGDTLIHKNDTSICTDGKIEHSIDSTIFNYVEINDTLNLGYLTPSSGDFLTLSPTGGVYLSTPSGGGSVNISGTPADNQIAVWTNANTIEGDANFLWNGIDLVIDRGYGINLTDGSNNWQFEQFDANEIRWNYNGSQYYSMSTGWGLARESTGGFYLDYNVASSTNPAYTFYDDDNTGIGHAGSDQLSLIAGGSEGIRICTDSINAYDTIYLKYTLSGAKSQPMWAAIDSITGALYGDSLADAGFGLTMAIPETIEEFMKDQHNDELPYYYKNQNNEIIKEYTIKGNPGRVIQKLSSRDEIIIRYVAKLEEENKELLERLERLEELIKTLK